MSFLSLPRSRLSQTALLSRRFLVPASTTPSFHSSASRSVLKESDRHREEGNDVASEIEKHKQSQIDQHKNGHDKAGWVEELASSSEENVKADRGEIRDAAFDKFQEKKEREKGKSA
ncbi:predicted protein [Uncinocarpus reesii 1704]|uniref:Mitochondrial carrier protein PET8 n=1 Tax=Uncinocarpus reesii (strain UAMH 1704) TaxID=336963 RepID=C4JDQ6_UNCRE|nr:uncharacterized protein UREG_00370 [Uncinocarpus reesii 1704]EEP75524.1 predicted protein [Uncinocarpus reesii 1704]